MDARLEQAVDEAWLKIADEERLLGLVVSGWTNACGNCAHARCARIDHQPADR